MAKKSVKKGIFITFEGPEGCGKTTHSKLLYDYLTKLSYASVYTREPGGTKVGEKIRDVLLHSNEIHISDLTELFLFESARAQIVEEVIRPALLKKRIVICDRYADASLSYQGYGARLPLKIIAALNDISTGLLKPDLTILLDIDTLTGLKRAESKGIDRMQMKKIAYHKRVRIGYLKLAKKDPRRIKVIRLADNIKETQRRIIREVGCVIQRYNRAG